VERPSLPSQNREASVAVMKADMFKLKKQIVHLPLRGQRWLLNSDVAHQNQLSASRLTALCEPQCEHQHICDFNTLKSY
jgi:hypothetical protein